MNRRVWVIGAGGLLGRAVRRAFERATGWDDAQGESLDWSASPDQIRAAVVATTLRLNAQSDEPWSVVWAAGGSTTGVSSERAETERASFAAALAGLEDARADLAAVFVASSAGGVYAGSISPPFSEATTPLPLSHYGRLKLAMEAEASDFADRTGHRIVIGRISNLYGPDQHLDKRQGLISHLAIARFGGPPVTLWVPLETARDYLYADDAARLLLGVLHRAESMDAGTVLLKNISSGQSVSISDLLAIFRNVTKRKPVVVLGLSAESAFQATDLRIASTVWTDLDAFDKMPLPAGIQSTVEGILASLQRGELSA